MTDEITDEDLKTAKISTITRDNGLIVSISFRLRDGRYIYLKPNCDRVDTDQWLVFF